MALGALYVGVCALFWAYEPAFVFAQVHRPASPPQAAGLKGFAEVTITTDDGVPLYGWWGPGSSRATAAIVYLTGSGLTLSGLRRVDRRPGGASSWRRRHRLPRQRRLAPARRAKPHGAATRRAGFDFVQGAAPGAKIAVFGESMGTGLAVGLARRRDRSPECASAPIRPTHRFCASSSVTAFHRRWACRCRSGC